MNAEYKLWLDSVPKDSELGHELALIQNDTEAIDARFLHPMRFGTAGLRAVMGAGTARMNIYTVARVSDALARIIIRNGGEKRGAAIACDSRNNSTEFANIAARVLAHRGVKVYIFDGIRPTPELSFAILHFGCIAGINITASHNPKEYNGYKVYWEDGAQLPPEQADAVSALADDTDVFGVELADFDTAVADGTITVIGDETDEAFLTAVLGCRIRPNVLKEHGNALNLIYTPLHGTGYRLVPEVLRRAGITNLRTVPEQMVLDGNFPTVASPNPEYTSCFELAIKQADATGDCSMLIGTDPDGDRIGVCVRRGNGEWFALNGNQIGALLIDYIINGRKEQHTLPSNAAAVRSIVSGGLFDVVCRDGNVECVTVLTGFKYIGEKIKEWAQDGSKSFIFGYEESHGFLTAGYARDKDAVAASLLVAEMAAYHLSNGKTLFDALQALYDKYGYFLQGTVENKIGGNDPMREMERIMFSLREKLPDSVCGTKVLAVRDYASGIIRRFDGSTGETNLPKSNVLFFELADGSSVVVRPSGTEPKVKVYVLTGGKTPAEAQERLERYTAFKLG